MTNAELLEFGVGMYSQQSTYMRPRRQEFLYREALDHARLAERLEFDSFWAGEHHLSYDGYLPSMVPFLAYVAAGTARIKVGAAVLVLPLHNAVRIAEQCAAVNEFAPGRLRLAMGAGYREQEFAAVGRALKGRARLMEENLEALSSPPLAARFGDAELWMGGAAEPVIRRAARYGASLLLTMSRDQAYLDEMGALYRSEVKPRGAQRPQIQVIRDAWVSRDPRELEWIRHRQMEMWTHYTRFWADDSVRSATRTPEKLVASAPIGTPTQVVDELAPLVEWGVDGIIFRVRFDGIHGEAVARCMELLAAEVAPSLRRMR